MIKKILLVVFILFSFGLIGYLSLPNLNFPDQLPGSYQSHEPGDSETPLRRGYYTDMTRTEVMAWYKKQFKWGITLNYPPEEAQTLIRDQTKSTFLQEIVHPLRESIYVNGFEPNTPEYQIYINGVHYRQKIIVRFVDSSRPVRIIVGIMITALVYLLYKEFKNHE